MVQPIVLFSKRDRFLVDVIPCYKVPVVQSLGQKIWFSFCKHKEVW